MTSSYSLSEGSGSSVVFFESYELMGDLSTSAEFLSASSGSLVDDSPRG